jgi:putative transposase
VQHSDAGARYSAIRYADRLAEAGGLASIGTVGDSYDNAKPRIGDRPLQDRMRPTRRPVPHRRRPRTGHLSWVHWFITAHLHSALDYATPVELENVYHR